MSMGRINLMAWSVALGLSMVAGAACAAAAPAATAASATQASQGDVLRATLDNGLRVVIVHDSLAPMVTTQITYLTGGYETPKGFPGTAHALEHMMFRDSKGMTGAQLNEMTGKMGGGNNAFTTNDATQYYFVAPAQYLDVLLNIEATRMQGLLVSAKDWKLESGAIEQEVSRDISDPDYLAYAQAEKILYKGTGYENDPLGSRPTFDKTTSKILKKFHSDWYVPNNAIFVIVGDVDPQATLASVKKLFDKIPERVTPKRTPVKLAKFKPITLNRTTPEGTGSVQFMYRMPGMQTTDYAASQILMDVLNNPRSGLSDLAAQGKVLSADAGTQGFTHGGIGTIEVGFAKGASSKKAQGYMHDAIAKVLKDGVSEDLVTAAKRFELAQSEFNKNSAVTLASEWSWALAWQGLDSPAQADQQIKDVTVADVDRVARQYLKPDTRVTVVLTPNPNGKRPPNSNGFGGSESFGSNDKLDAPLPVWATKALAKLEVPHWTLDPTEMTLSNGIHLIVQPESISDTVTVVGHVDHNTDLQEPKGQDGVGQLLGSLFDYGTKDMDRATFHKALDDISAHESGGADFRLSVLSEHLDRGMQLLADNELHPALPAKAFKVQQGLLAHRLAGEMQSPRYKMNRALQQGLLPKNDPGLRRATPKSVNALALKNVQDYYAATYRPDLTTIVMVGKITPAQAKASVEHTFGDWKASGPKPNVVAKPVPVNPPSYAVVKNSYASQDQVLMGQMVDVNLSNPDRYALDLGNDVLGGNGFASRLMVDVRVRHGYAYGASSGLNFDRSRSIFYIYYGSDPSKVPLVDKLIQKNLVEMRTKPVSKSELTNARQAEIRSIPLRVSSVKRIASSLLSWSYHGEPLNQPMIAAKHYLSLTAGDVQTAFNKYVKPDHLVQVVQGPTPKKH